MHWKRKKQNVSIHREAYNGIHFRANFSTIRAPRARLNSEIGTKGRNFDTSQALPDEEFRRARARIESHAVRLNATASCPKKIDLRVNEPKFCSIQKRKRRSTYLLALFSRVQCAHKERSVYKNRRTLTKVAFFSLAKEIKIPLLSLSYALLFSTRISSRICAGCFRRERISLNLFFLPSEEEYYIESRRRSTYSRRSNFLCWFPLRSLLCRNDRKKNQKREKRKVSEGSSFPTKKKKNVSKRRDQ